MIEIKNISKSFGDTKVIDNVSYVFEQGKTNLIIGESGSGKTTIMKLMVGLHNVDSGEILYDGQNFPTLGVKEKQEVRKKIGMLFQGGALFDSQTLEENVRFPLDMFTTMSKEEKLDRVNFCLEKVQLTNKNKLYPGELSGGMKKRAALARAIANNPQYLFCDEPNSGLDPKTSIVIDNLIQSLTREFNITTIVITHDMNSVVEIGEKILYIYKGKHWWTGNSQEILKTTNPELVDFVFASGFMKEVFNAVRNK
ncbi:MAG: transporter ATP-binding protein [Bacteroidetes bacterium]|jgi:phospholipid/cholesterol/gamma-HCH transport system ATP-binding protein|nr:transporter ATP-binding protein [Bacteroidota bacterium]MDF2452249.1 transporter ATP-binding protein [Bacteroidota bacterium]